MPVVYADQARSILLSFVYSRAGYCSAYEMAAKHYQQWCVVTQLWSSGSEWHRANITEKPQLSSDTKDQAITICWPSYPDSYSHLFTFIISLPGIWRYLLITIMPPVSTPIGELHLLPPHTQAKSTTNLSTVYSMVHGLQYAVHL